MKYYPGILKATYRNHVEALRAYGCTHQKALELLVEAGLARLGIMMFSIGRDPEENYALYRGPDGRTMLFEAYKTFACNTQTEVRAFIDHIDERRKEPGVWMILEEEDEVVPAAGIEPATT